MKIRPRTTLPTVGFPISNPLKGEIGSLYWVRHYSEGQPVFQGADRNDLDHPGDRDRLHGGHCSLEALGDQVCLVVGALDRRELPQGVRYQDLSYDSQLEQVALQGYSPKNQRWEVTQVKLAGDQPGQVLYAGPEPFQGIEYAADGRLFLAQGDKVLTLTQDQELALVHQCPGRVQDLNTLADGALLLRVESHSPTQSDLIYIPQGEPDAVYLPLGLDQDWQEWLSPDGRGSVGHFPSCPAHQRNQRLYARDEAWEYGNLLEGLQLFPGARLDPESVGWSCEGRYLKATTLLDPQWFGSKFQDSLLWDSHSRQVHLLPRINSVDFNRGQMILQGLGQEIRLDPQGLEDLEQQDWYRKHLALPAVAVRGSNIRLIHRDGRQENTTAGRNTQRVVLGANQQYLIGLTKDNSAEIRDCLSGRTLETPPGFEAHWDEESSRLKLVEASSTSQISSSERRALKDFFGFALGQPQTFDLSGLPQTCYQQALEDFLASAPQEASTVAREQGGTRYNGLLLPRRNH